MLSNSIQKRESRLLQIKLTLIAIDAFMDESTDIVLYNLRALFCRNKRKVVSALLGFLIFGNCFITYMLNKFSGVKYIFLFI